MKKTLMGLLCIFCSLSNMAFAAEGGDRDSAKITAIQWYENHVGLLVRQERMSDYGGCGRSDWYILDENHPYFKEAYSLILAAHISSQPVMLYMDGCVQGISRIKHITSYK